MDNFKDPKSTTAKTSAAKKVRSIGMSVMALILAVVMIFPFPPAPRLAMTTEVQP